ncbi:MAG: type II toxin-antitoxin system VapC family toxin, partial [Actinomycetales bacterium]
TGKLRAPDDLLDQVSRHDFVLLEISGHHAVEASSLPDHHRDPFDRMLIAQALVERLTVVSRDRIFSKYGVSLLVA